MLSVEEALEQVLSHATPKQPTLRQTHAALGLVLAEDVASDVDSPPHDKSVVDGYAVVSTDLVQRPAELEVLEEITAGAVPKQRVVSGKATRIMTGASLPEGADAVVMIEHSQTVPASKNLQRVQISCGTVTPGQNITRRAVCMARGQTILRSGAVLRPAEIGLLAEVGRSSVLVIDRPTAAILSTGNELVPASQIPGPGQIRNSNGPLLASAVQAAGATANELGIARDEREPLRQLVAAGLQSDALVISGGVSAGVLDLVPSVLEELKVRQIFHKIRLKPGKPLWFGVAENGCLVFGLPGNPLSSFVCFELFVRPALARLAGRAGGGLEEVTAELACEQKHRGDRPTYQPAYLENVEGGLRVKPLKWQGSGDLRILAEANALACLPGGDREFRAGEVIRVLRLAP